MMFPLVRELADDGIPVTVTCRVLKLCRQHYYRWLKQPVTDRELAEAWLANAIFDAHRDDPEFGYRFLADEVRDGGHDGDGAIRGDGQHAVDLHPVDRGDHGEGPAEARPPGEERLQPRIVLLQHQHFIALAGRRHAFAGDDGLRSQWRR